MRWSGVCWVSHRRNDVRKCPREGSCESDGSGSVLIGPFWRCHLFPSAVSEFGLSTLESICLSLRFFAVLWVSGYERQTVTLAGILEVIISSVVIGSGKFSVL